MTSIKRDKIMNTNKRSTARNILLASGFACLPNQWKAPIVKAVILPAHAQTSVCSMDSVAGTWDLFVLDVGLIVELNAIGTGVGGDGDLSWSLDGNNISISLVQSAGQHTYLGTLGASCNLITGTVSNSVTTNSFTGTKLFL